MRLSEPKQLCQEGFSHAREPDCSVDMHFQMHALSGNRTDGLAIRSETDSFESVPEGKHRALRLQTSSLVSFLLAN